MKIAEVQLNYKPTGKLTDLETCTGSADAEKFFRSIWGDKIDYIEQFYVLLLNRSSKIIGFLKISEGGTCGTVVDAKVVFQGALKTNAHNIILCHNHPSGNKKPSEPDISLTKKLREAGKYLEITVLDHIILTSESYFSFADEGLI